MLEYFPDEAAHHLVLQLGVAEDEVVEEQLAVVGSLPGTLLDTERDELRELGAELSRGKRGGRVKDHLLCTEKNLFPCKNMIFFYLIS